MIDVFIVEDDEPFSALLSRELSKTKKIRIVGCSPTAEQAIREIPRLNPGLVILDIKLPGMNGIECLRRLKEPVALSRAKVLMLTGNEDSQLIFEALKAGANGYLSKDHISGKELSVAIRDVAAGGGVMSPSIARKVIQFFQAPATTVSKLSKREMEVLANLSEGLTSKEIADKLSISENTVHKHLASIYTKLHVRSRTEAVRHYLQRPH
jgi:DNA-binding NarL/FixJ family response regulator